MVKDVWLASSWRLSPPRKRSPLISVDVSCEGYVWDATPISKIVDVLQDTTQSPQTTTP